MTKYIIKNCPALSYGRKKFKKCYRVGWKQDCKDYENCPIKRIVEECREEIKPICQIPDGCCGMKNIYSDSKEFAEKLLSYLEIEECK